MRHYNLVHTRSGETIMSYLEDHRIDGNNIKGGWIMVVIANLGLVILAL